MHAVTHLYKTSTFRVPSDLFISLFALCTAKFNAKNFTFPDSACINVFIYLSNQSAVIFLCKFKCLILKNKDSVCALRSKVLNRQINFRLILVFCVVPWYRRLVAGLSTRRFGCAGFLRVFPLTSPNDKTKFQNIVYHMNRTPAHSSIAESPKIYYWDDGRHPLNQNPWCMPQSNYY